jgi:hypothetical protein
VNTEELEQSLRAEFEGYMKNVLGEMRRDVADLQGKFEVEFEKHRSVMDEAFRSLSGRFDSAVEFDPAFRESVTEHLRLARDEGALVTAKALGEAEKLGSDSTNQEFQKLRKGINEIKSHNTQATILRALVETAATFAPRGAFFILKNDHLVGWKVFGRGDLVDEDTVRSIHFPIESDTLLSNSINSLSVKGAGIADRDENSRFLDPLRFGDPERMFAIPLSARGRGVAVLYVDGGEGNENVNLDALETLVTVAGLTVELLASSGAPAPAETHQPSVPVVSQPEPQAESQVAETGEAEPSVAETIHAESEAQYFGDVAVEPEAEAVSEAEPTYVVEEESVAEEPISEGVVAYPFPEEPRAEIDTPTTDFAFIQENFVEEVAAPVEVSSEEVEVERFDANQTQADVPAGERFDVNQPPGEVTYEVPSVAVADTQPRQRERRVVDLPIEVAEDERRSHSDARRFARLLVSEIRLYNEQRVVEGREAGDIYEMLKEAIDRSREMYDKRVQPEVASKFDYFHYELVNNLAEGDEEKLGTGYLAVKA